MVKIMHIPDGYLSPQTAVTGIAVSIPIFTIAIKKVKAHLSHKQIPFLSLCAAFSFIVMMFNVPIGPSSVHAIGAVFIVILLGPYAACIAVSVALIIQALIFGDGGVLSLGVNCFNMAIVMPFSGYFIYKLFAGKSVITSKRSMAGVFAGSYIGINLAALCTAIEFGIQPLIFKSASNVPLYGYFPLSVSVPSMGAEHLLIAGPIEGIITVGAISYIAKFAPHLLPKNPATSDMQNEKKSFWVRYKALLIGFAVLVIFTPIGLLATGTAWGEWGVNEIKQKIGFIPTGFAKLSEIWKAIMPNYSIKWLGNSFFGTSLGYIISAVIGIALIFIIILVTSKLIVKEQGKNG
jgi:cobalt/nickel transport system permease protein